MSVGMASFGTRGEELDAVEVARRAAGLIWDNKLRVLPYLALMIAVTAAVRWIGYRYGFPMDGADYSFNDHESLAEFARRGAWTCARALASGLAVGMTLRTLLGQAQPWRPDRGLLGFAAIWVGAAAMPLLIFLPCVLAWAAGGMMALPMVVLFAVAGVGAFFTFLYFCLRLIIWPVGVAAGDAQMTAGRAWQAMLGARLAWLFAGILLTLPLIFGAALAGAFAMGIYGIHGPVVGPWEAPLHGLAALLWIAVAAAVYQLRAEPVA